MLVILLLQMKNLRPFDHSFLGFEICYLFASSFMNIPHIKHEHIEGNPTYVRYRGVKFITSRFRKD